MGDILVKKTLSLQVVRTPAQAGAPLSEADFAIEPAEQISISSYSEDQGGRFHVAAMGELELSMGTITLGKLFALAPEADVGLVITNGVGDSQTIKVKGGAPGTIDRPGHSVMHAEFTALKLINSTASVIKGRYIVAGD